MKFSLAVNRRSGLLFDIGKMQAALEGAVDDTAESIAEDLEKPTKDWKTKVKIAIRKIANGRIISTDNEIYRYVSGGTKRHVIRAKNAKYLAFGSVYTPKTKVNSLEGMAGNRGSADTFRKEVQHPGTEARNFDKIAAANARKVFANRVRKAVREGLR